MVAHVYTSKEDFLSNVIRPFNARMASPLRPTVRDMYADGDVPYRNTYSWFLSLRDNRIVKASQRVDVVVDVGDSVLLTRIAFCRRDVLLVSAVRAEADDLIAL